MRKKYKDKDRESSSVNVLMVDDGYNNDNILIVNEKHTYEELILDSRCSYHMSPFKKWFNTYKVVASSVI